MAAHTPLYKVDYTHMAVSYICCCMPCQTTHQVHSVPALPQDGCARLWRGHVVHRVLHDEVAVGTADCQGATGAALANDHTDDGHS
eukprot:1148082-Pelagomonas_calceolata.AAC.5